MLLVALLGTLYLATGSEPLAATTATGTTVMGLGPPIFLMLVWQYDEGGKAGWRQSPLAFVFPFLAGSGSTSISSSS